MQLHIRGQNTHIVDVDPNETIAAVKVNKLNEQIVN